MKILTLNTHSLLEENYEEKLRIFADGISKVLPQVIALQEVNQTSTSPVVSSHCLGFSSGEVPLKEDNHAIAVTELLSEKGINYNFVWCPIKQGYSKFDEGLAFLSLEPIQFLESFVISNTQKYQDWKKRKALVVKIYGMNFCTAHLGWWQDEYEPFAKQFDKLNEHLLPYKDVIILGDFNSPDSAENEGYDYVTSLGWNDFYNMADKKNGHHTVVGPIAGWKQKDNLRIDYIFSKEKLKVRECSTMFDGLNFPVVSDHYAVTANFERGVV